MVREGYLTYSIKIENLSAETDYVIHLQAEDRGLNTGERVELLLTTLKRYNSCDFTLIFNERSMD